MQHVTFSLIAPGSHPKVLQKILLWTVKQSHLQSRVNFIQVIKPIILSLSGRRWSVDLRLVHKFNVAVLGMVEARSVVLFQEDEHVGSRLEKGGWHIERHLGTNGRPVAEDDGCSD